MGGRSVVGGSAGEPSRADGSAVERAGASEVAAASPEPSQPERFGGADASVPSAPDASGCLEYLRKARRMRRIVGASCALLAALVVAAGIAGWRIVEIDRTAIVQQPQFQAGKDVPAAGEEDGSAPAGDEGSSAAANGEGSAADGEGDDGARESSQGAQATTVPNLVNLLGLDIEDAVEDLERGAQVTSTRDVDSSGDVRAEAVVALAAEAGHARSGTPEVVLGLDDDGEVVEASYSVATSALGYGSLSFTDAVENERIIERTLAAAGVRVEEGAAELPADKMAYSTYDTDGTTLMRESETFFGEGVVAAGEGAGTVVSWTARLEYDYARANAEGNLAYTLRTVTVGVKA